MAETETKRRWWRWRWRRNYKSWRNDDCLADDDSLDSAKYIAMNCSFCDDHWISWSSVFFPFISCYFLSITFLSANALLIKCSNIQNDINYSLCYYVVVGTCCWTIRITFETQYRYTTIDHDCDFCDFCHSV